MRKFLIIALSLAVVGALTDIAYAKEVEMASKLSSEQLHALCDRKGGTFVPEAGGSSRCDLKGGRFVECNKNKDCIYVTPFTADRNKVGGKTLAGNLANTTKPGGRATGPSGGTATGASKGGGVMSGSMMSGATMPPGTRGGPGSVTAATSNPTLNPTLLSTGGALGATKTGVSTGPIVGGIINGRKP
jgi:hypothetical protein